MRGRTASLAVALLFTGVSNPVFSDDLYPPDFRNFDGARVDEWNFTDPEGNWVDRLWYPEKSTGFPQSRLLVPEENSPTTGWEAGFAGRPGVWRLDSNDAAEFTFSVPNIPDRILSKAIIIQITWFATDDQDFVPIVINDDTGDAIPWSEEVEPVTMQLENGWTYDRYHLWSDTCPQSETVLLQPSPQSVVYVDQVVIDTICIQPIGGDEDDPNLPDEGDDNEQPDDPDLPNPGDITLLVTALIGAIFGFGLAWLVMRVRS